MAGRDALLIRRVALDVTTGQISADPRAWRRRTLHPDQRTLALAELAAVYAYSFIVTHLDISTPAQTAGVEAVVPTPDLDREHL